MNALITLYCFYGNSSVTGTDFQGGHILSFMERIWRVRLCFLTWENLQDKRLFDKLDGLTNCLSTSRKKKLMRYYCRD